MVNVTNCDDATRSGDAEDDEQALMYILVVLAIYVSTLAFFFIRFLSVRKENNSELNTFIDEYMERDITDQRLMVSHMRERLQLAKSPLALTDKRMRDNGGDMSDEALKC
ncbi:uncharacterized protein [Watersipora subatra]|uniref:uncharacterized protein n=1 Tax=Watersipora subatra TaxID=2589382 RepID=UPI00355BCFE4